MSDFETPNFADDELNSFIAGTEEQFQAPDPATVVTVRTSSGSSAIYVPVPEGQTLTAAEVLVAGSITLAGAYEIWLNGARIKTSDVVPAGSEITVVGSVKGG